MMSRRKKAAMFAALVAGLVIMLGGGAAIFVANGQPWPALAWALVVAVAVTVTCAGFVGFLRETDPALVDEGGYSVVAPPADPLPPATDRKNPWPVEWLAPALAEAFAGTPYVVRSNGRSILVHADLVDARWQHVATVHHLRQTFVARFTPTGTQGVIRRTDESRRLETSAGPTRLGAQLGVSSGRQWGRTRRVEYGLGPDGFRKRVDYEFSTEEINEPVREIMTRAGWRATLDAESKGALVMGAMGLSALVLVPLGLLAKHLAG
ncbi:hypothetical protein [Janibacter limosus]|uniref:Uncharacterized protein n=1 Tax=Janibacter limosus TaxID=53458 RepID=A0A4P6MYD9_9MICO|nr:hypothetical protein [Janibacter limosus]QBF46593.1 hypothetical protein EXU32_10195 [Janibacter limosus]